MHGKGIFSSQSFLSWSFGGQSCGSPVSGKSRGLCACLTGQAAAHFIERKVRDDTLDAGVAADDLHGDDPYIAFLLALRALSHKLKKKSPFKQIKRVSHCVCPTYVSRAFLRWCG